MAARFAAVPTRRPYSPRRRQLLLGGLALGATTLSAAGAPAAPEPPLSRPVPSSGVRLTVVGLGTNRFRSGDAAWMDRLRATLETFSRLGGKLVDTAPAYGDAERVIGTLLGATGLRPRLFIATKVDRESVAEGRQRLTESFAALATPRLDLVQLHSLRGAATMLPVLREQQAAGHLDHLGVTTSSADQDAELEALIRREKLDFVQLDYALGNRRAAARLLPLAADRGMAVLVNLPFGRGAQFRAVGQRPLPAWAAEIDCSSWAQVFLKYVIAHPAVTCVIPGSTQPAHVADNLAAARGRLPDTALQRTIASYFDAIRDG